MPAENIETLRRYFGHEGLRQWREDTFDVIEGWRLELDEVITGDDPDTMVAVERE